MSFRARFLFLIALQFWSEAHAISFSAVGSSVRNLAPNLTQSVVFQGQEVERQSLIGRSLVKVTTIDVRNREHECSGVVLNSNYILTAAHCVDVGNWKPKQIKVHFKIESEMFTYMVQSAFHSEEYSGKNDMRSTNPEEKLAWANRDIAILRLRNPLPDFMMAAPISEVPVEASRLLLAGFGVIAYEVSGDPKRPFIPVVGDKMMTAPYELESSNAATPLTQSRQCEGDSGGAVFAQTDGGLVLYGVISRLERGPEEFKPCEGSPRVHFASLAQNQEFIHHVLNGLPGPIQYDLQD